MSIIHTFISRSDTARLSRTDSDYLSRKLKDKCMLNSILNRKVNRPLLNELHCVLDSKPIPRRKTEQHSRCSKVLVYKNGMLIRIEHASGRVLRRVE